MAKKKLKLSGEALAFFQKVGRKGGRNRAKKHSPKQLQAWAKLGGRPRKKTIAEPQAEAVA
jgi:hypothetical protein